MSVRKIAKALGAKKISGAVNFNSTLNLNNRKFKIPVIHNMGIENTKVKPDFIYNLFRYVKMSDKGCFLDIGVNVGQTLLKFRSCRNNQYIGFEPNPACVHYLTNLINANKMKHATIIPIGLSSSNTIVSFYQKSDVDTAGTMVNDLRPDYYTEDDLHYIPVFTLDSVDVINDKKIELIKVDVEGAESDVLIGMARVVSEHKPAIICEVLDSHTEENVKIMQPRADKLVATVHAYDYKVYRLDHSDATIKHEEVSEIKLRKWVPESEFLNDYVFLPSNVSFTDVIQL